MSHPVYPTPPSTSALLEELLNPGWPVMEEIPFPTTWDVWNPVYIKGSIFTISTYWAGFLNHQEYGLITSLYFQINKCCQGKMMENLHFKKWTLKQIELYIEYKLIMHKFSQIKFGTLRKCSWCTFMWGALDWKGSGGLWYRLGVTQWFFVSSKRHILIFR